MYFHRVTLACPSCGSTANFFKVSFPRDMASVRLESTCLSCKEELDVVIPNEEIADSVRTIEAASTNFDEFVPNGPPN